MNMLTGAKSDNLVVIDDIHYSRGDNQIFKGLDMQIPRGKVTAILGPSGTGKTTLLHLITGQLNPDRGAVLFEGRVVCPCSRHRLYEVRRKMGVLFQQGALLTNLSVFENIAFPLREHTDLCEQLIRQIVTMKLHAVGLRTAWQSMPSQLSGGMARRVALARALVMDPKLIIYDEPFAGLDPISMGVIVRLIRMTNDALGVTSIVVTHDVDQTRSLADLSYLISGGKVAAHGTPEELCNDKSDLVRQFMRGRADGPVPFHLPGPGYAEQLQSMSRR
jgi:phospholipid/cholesterol/gamma-HCH transport system ATP-binding protein